MTRSLLLALALALAALLSASSTALAQDMPLSQILIDGEGWKKVEGKPAKPKGAEVRFVSILAGDGSPISYGLILPSGRVFDVMAFPSVPIPTKSKTLNPPPDDKPTAALITPDGGTLYLAGEAQKHIWAYRVEKDGTTTARDRYAPLRVKRGEHTIAVTSLATDRDGRIYAATEIGIQVFDPTGRLCGVMTAPLGKAEIMMFEGDKLTLWIGDTKYSRKLNTTGPK